MDRLPTEILEMVLMYAVAAESNDTRQRWAAIRNWLSAVNQRCADIVDNSTFQKQYGGKCVTTLTN